MPDSKDNAKMTGDTHLPDVESDLLPQEDSADAVGLDGTPRDRGQASKDNSGELKDRDAETSNSYGKTRDSGEGGSGPDRG